MALGSLAPAGGAQTYSATQLPTLGGTQSAALSINNAGTIAGNATFFGDTITHAISYSNGTTIDLGTLGGTNSYSQGINSAGVVVGNSEIKGNTTTQAFSVGNRVMSNLGTLGGTQSYAQGINSIYTIAGFATLAGDTATHAFFYANNMMTDIGTLGGPNSHAYGINAAGTIVGSADYSAANHHAFSYAAGVMTDLGALGGVKSTALGINDAGYIVGDAQTALGAIHAFSYFNGLMTDLGTIGNAAGNSFAYAVNSAGTIVGFSAAPASAQDAFVYSNGQMTDLNSLVSLPGVTLVSAPGINDLGQIIANGSDGRAYLLTPAAYHLSLSAPNLAEAGTPVTVTVTVLDGSNNPLTGYSGLIQISSSDGSAVVPPAGMLTNGTGTFNVTLKTVGNQTITAADTAISSISATTPPIDVIAVVAPTIAVQPVAVSASIGANAAFWVVANGTRPLFYQWSVNGAPIPGATNPLLVDVGVGSSDAGNYTVTVSNPAGSVTSTPAALTINTVSPANPITATSQPMSQTVAAGSTVAFNFITGSSPGTVTAHSVNLVQAGVAVYFQWFLNNVAIIGATDPVYVINGATAASSGTYTCVAVDSSGVLVSGAATLNVVSGASPGRLINLSCRVEAGTGANELIAGFVVGGQGTSGTEPVLIRASGPALAQFGVTGVLPDPLLQLNNFLGEVASDSGWGGNAQIAAAAAAVGAFAWNSASSLDSAFLQSLTEGAYTAQISGKSGDSGVALAEIYDATPAASYTPASPRLVNLSARAQVGTGGGVLIAGFVIGGTTSRTVLIRGSGPALGAFGVSGTLPDPLLQLNQSNATGGSTLLATNNGWNADTQISAAATAVGAFSWGLLPTRDSAILITLPPGAYTAEVSGAGGDTGIGLIEVYEVP